jgi:hypothetical protein
VINGLFNVQLGWYTYLPDSLFEYDNRWLGVTVGDDLELSPQTRFISVPYAFHAYRADTADYAQSTGGGSGGGWVDDGSVVRLDNELDYVGIGTNSPANKLHVVGTSSEPAVNVEKNGPGRGLRVYTTSACALWVENSGNHGLRVTNAAGDGVHVTQAGNWAGYFNGKGYFADNVGIGTLTPTSELHVVGDLNCTGNLYGGSHDHDDQYSLVYADLINDNTDASGNVDITYPVGKFSDTPNLSVTAQFNSAGIAQMGFVTVSGHTKDGYTLNVKDGNGTNWNGSVQISYTAVQ